MAILTQFLFRLSFGLAIGMAAISPRQVQSGYFRVHLWVILGLHTLAALIAWRSEYPLWPPLAGAALAYVGSVCWLYEQPRAGRACLILVAAAALAGAWDSLAVPPYLSSTLGTLLWLLDPAAGGLVLGVTMAAMLLGHWYLNSPGMQLAPLRRLLVLMALALVARGVIAAVALGLELSLPAGLSSQWLSEHTLLFVLRWAWGILGPLALVWMAWQTLKVPNTQSATGILYVAVIATFLGELTAQLLSAGTLFPV